MYENKSPIKAAKYSSGQKEEFHSKLPGIKKGNEISPSMGNSKLSKQIESAGDGIRSPIVDAK